MAHNASGYEKAQIEAQQDGIRNAQRVIGGKAAVELKKGDHVPEIYFIGQVVGGQDWTSACVLDEGVFVEASLKYGADWQLLEDDPLSGPI
mgnify:CR=1 FL=1